MQLPISPSTALTGGLASPHYDMVKDHHSIFESSRGFSNGVDSPRTAQFKNQLFKYPEPPPHQLLNVPWIQHEYDQLRKMIMKVNEKLIPFLLKRKFDPETTGSGSRERKANEDI